MGTSALEWHFVRQPNKLLALYSHRLKLVPRVNLSEENALVCAVMTYGIPVENAREMIKASEAGFTWQEVLTWVRLANGVLAENRLNDETSHLAQRPSTPDNPGPALREIEIGAKHLVGLLDAAKDYESMDREMVLTVAKQLLRIRDTCDRFANAVLAAQFEKDWRTQVDSTPANHDKLAGALRLSGEYPGEYFRILVAERMAPLVC